VTEHLSDFTPKIEVSKEQLALADAWAKLSQGPDGDGRIWIQEYLKKQLTMIPIDVVHEGLSSNKICEVWGLENPDDNSP
jgi:hypothetical protein